MWGRMRAASWIIFTESLVGPTRQVWNIVELAGSYCRIDEGTRVCHHFMGSRIPSTSNRAMSYDDYDSS